MTGDLSDTGISYIGSRPVKLFRVSMQGGEAVLAMSSRTWISYYYSNRFHLTPLSYDTLEYAAGFSSEQCPEGFVAISTNPLRILTLEKLGAVFNQVAFPLEFTPRTFVVHPDSCMMILIETDHNAYTKDTKTQRKIQMVEEMREAAGEDEQELANEMAEAFLTKISPNQSLVLPRLGLECGPPASASRTQSMCYLSLTEQSSHWIGRHSFDLWPNQLLIMFFV